MVRNKLIHELVIEQKSDCQWIGKINNELVCEFNYYKDCKGKYWINDISTFDPFKEIGVGTKMIENALSIYNEIYVSTAEKHEIKTVGIKGDLRYTNEFSFEESDLKRFVDKLVNKGILKQEWILHPFKKHNINS